ncbi:MAG: hypothetical protein LBS23_01375 [Holosporaceae bacterium]|jgi:F-type H+-transporting ATPase subunit b|nr:hypothetical protein [Holosporaceae bacterium]
MPQLVTATFPSQIFWTLVGFFCVYIFVSRIAVPKIEEIINKRVALIDDLLKRANQLSFEANKLEKDSIVALENAQIESKTAETQLISDLREQNIKEKKLLYDSFAEKSVKEVKIISLSAQKALSDVLKNNIDDILNTAMSKAFGDLKNNS